METNMSAATAKRAKKPIKGMHAVLWRLEALQYRVESSSENHEINECKHRLMELLRKWENAK
jgi:hypothetical protein